MFERELKPHTGHNDALFLTAHCLSSKRSGGGEVFGLHSVLGNSFAMAARALVWWRCRNCAELGFIRNMTNKKKKKKKGGYTCDFKAKVTVMQVTVISLA